VDAIIKGNIEEREKEGKDAGSQIRGMKRCQEITAPNVIP